MGDSLEGGTEQSLEAQNVSIVDYRAFNNYIRKAITILLFDDSEELTSSKLEEALDENRANQECIKKFLSDPQVQTLYIQKCYTKGEIIFFSIFRNGDFFYIFDDITRQFYRFFVPIRCLGIV